ncbi:hypothetical protein K438DRAFT_1749724 [Mycena galopus ATCC 62051]|nr:hypothetical protein K438DRAFT_1749724 [Mycena galopus ATCC 62051]
MRKGSFCAASEGTNITRRAHSAAELPLDVKRLLVKPASVISTAVHTRVREGGELPRLVKSHAASLYPGLHSWPPTMQNYIHYGGLRSWPATYGNYTSYGPTMGGKYGNAIVAALHDWEQMVMGDPRTHEKRIQSLDNVVHILRKNGARERKDTVSNSESTASEHSEDKTCLRFAPA